MLIPLTMVFLSLYLDECDNEEMIVPIIAFTSLDFALFIVIFVLFQINKQRLQKVSYILFLIFTIIGFIIMLLSFISLIVEINDCDEGIGFLVPTFVYDSINFILSIIVLVLNKHQLVNKRINISTEHVITNRLEQELNGAVRLYNNNVISEEEYKKIRESIISKYYK